MHIRFYHPEDDPALMRLERLSPRGLPEPFVHYRRRFIDRAALFPDHHMLVAEDSGRIVGCVAVGIKRTHIGDRPVSVGYLFDARTDPTLRRRGIGTALIDAVEDYLIDRGVDGAYGLIVTSNVASLHMFDKLGYDRVRQIMMLVYQPYPSVDVPDWMPRHTDDYTVERDLVRAVHSGRDLFVPDVAERVKDFGFERWSLDLGGSRFAGFSVFDQSYVFQQWPAEEPFPAEDEQRARANRSLRLFDETGLHNPALLKSIFDNLRDVAVTDSVGKLTLLLDRMERAPLFLFDEAVRQLDYWLVFRSLNPDWMPEWQDGPIYVDSRDL